MAAQFIQNSLELPDSLTSECQTKIIEVLNLYDDDKVVKAHRILEECRSLCQSQQALDDINAIDICQKIDNDMKDLDDFLNVLNDENGWTLIEDSDNIQTLYRAEIDSPFHTIKTLMEVDCIATNIFPIFIEGDLLPTIISFLNIQAEILYHEEEGKIVVLVEMANQYDYPEIPFPGDDSCVRSSLIDMKSD